MGFKEYDPKDVVANWGGAQISGYADGTFIAITPAAEANVKTVGADGEVGRARTNDNTYEVVLTLLMTSPSNTVLSIMFQTNLALPLIIKHINGDTLFSAPYAWIRQMPDTEFGKEIGERAWTFDTGQVPPIGYISGGGQSV